MHKFALFQAIKISACMEVTIDFVITANGRNPGRFNRICYISFRSLPASGRQGG